MCTIWIFWRKKLGNKSLVALQMLSDSPRTLNPKVLLSLSLRAEAATLDHHRLAVIPGEAMCVLALGAVPLSQLTSLLSSGWDTEWARVTGSESVCPLRESAVGPRSYNE